MPKMVPLNAWVCDSCLQEVDIEDGWVEWLSPDKGGPHSFRICHNDDRCQKHTDHPDRHDGHLENFLGIDGMQYFLSFLDIGLLLDPNEKYMPSAPEMRSFVEAFRRLQIPHYEEARQYHSVARSEGYFSDQNEVSASLPSTCESIIKRYESEENA